MASTVIYPPIVENYMPAFIAGDDSYCRVYFSLSKFNSSEDFKSVQISIFERDTGQVAVDTSKVSATIHYDYDEDGTYSTATVYRSTGVILDMPFVIESQDDNIYYIDIDTTNLSAIFGEYTGWIPGKVYKLQLRLSQVNYADDNPQEEGQADWLVHNASYFSEWSTVCILKATGKPKITISSILDEDGNPYSSNEAEEEIEYFLRTGELIGKYYNTDDTSEYLYSYKFRISKINDGGRYQFIEESDTIYLNEDYLSGKIQYTTNFNIENDVTYSIVLEYQTRNNYNGYLEIICQGEVEEGEETSLRIYNTENDPLHLLSKRTNMYYEEEYGRIAYLIYGQEESSASIKGYYIRRAESTDNFKTWTDIKFIAISKTVLANYLFYDYTAESGIWYKYAIQLVDSFQERGNMVITENPILRDYNYSFLLGKNEKQLSLKFDNFINSFDINVDDSVQSTLGGRYPYISRNGNMNYKSFPLEGLITLNMDDKKMFCSDTELYKYTQIADLYKNRKKGMYDYSLERIFREKVMEFLTDGKPKLFKSPTEGNILVRLNEVSFSPNQSLGRLIYNFSGKAIEIGKASVDNLKKYGITDLTLVEAANDLEENEEHLNSYPANHLSTGGSV